MASSAKSCALLVASFAIDPGTLHHASERLRSRGPDANNTATNLGDAGFGAVCGVLAGMAGPRLANLREMDVLITTPHMILPNGLERKMSVHRLVMDEAHLLTKGSTTHSKLGHLQKYIAGRKWCVTGTPFSTDLAQLTEQSQPRFLRARSFSRSGARSFIMVARVLGAPSKLHCLFSPRRCSYQQRWPKGVTAAAVRPAAVYECSSL